jgi:hypothetical protein
MQTITLTSTAALAQLKASAQQASKDFIKNPSGFNWNRQTQTAFVYQQAYYFFGSVTHTDSGKQHLLALMENDPDHNWGDTICKCVLGVSLSAALREFANCP